MRAHSALLTATARTGWVYGFDRIYEARRAQADPDAEHGQALGWEPSLFPPGAWGLAGRMIGLVYLVGRG
ncbi:hypothetical protein [Streptomyces bullii]|uniref:Uncharacterized protein n=1 Tax=Streptomyces bullii TaxID=349910 RepID=A0ABW0UVN1_9ACTN